jgi:hypothetical protein
VVPPARVLPVLALALAVAACGGAAPQAAAPVARAVDDPAHGIGFDLPPGWHEADASLTPGLTDPREVLAVGTFPLVYREAACAHMPSSALEDMTPRDAFVTLQERGADAGSRWYDFPARPERFGPELGGPSEAAQCVPSARFSDHWFGFTDGGRHFHVLVAFGPEVSASVRAEAWKILDSLRIDPGVRPDWAASG